MTGTYFRTVVTYLTVRYRVAQGNTWPKAAGLGAVHKLEGFESFNACPKRGSVLVGKPISVVMSAARLQSYGNHTWAMGCGICTLQSHVLSALKSMCVLVKGKRLHV